MIDKYLYLVYDCDFREIRKVMGIVCKTYSMFGTLMWRGIVTVAGSRVGLFLIDQMISWVQVVPLLGNVRIITSSFSY